MRILVAGASGVIGLRLVRLLVASGHTVIGTTRLPERAAAGGRAAGATPLVVDVFDASAYFPFAARGSTVSGKHCHATPPLLASRP